MMEHLKLVRANDLKSDVCFVIDSVFNVATCLVIFAMVLA